MLMRSIALLSFAALLLASLPAAPAAAQTEELTTQRQSFLGAGVRFSADKPSFRGRATDTRESAKVKKATEKDPMAGGLLTGALSGGEGNVEYRYRYEYPYDASTVLFDGSAVGVLCEKCKAQAVLECCDACEGKPFKALCDKCKARAILNACDADRAKITGAAPAKSEAKKKRAAKKRTEE